MDNQDYNEYTLETPNKPKETSREHSNRKKKHTLAKVLAAIVIILGLLLGLLKCGSSNNQEQKERENNDPPQQTEEVTASEAAYEGAVYAAFTSEPLTYTYELETEWSDSKQSGTVFEVEFPAEQFVRPDSIIVTRDPIAATPMPVAAPSLIPTAAPTPRATLSPRMRQIVEPAMKEIVNAASTPKPMVYRTLTDEEIERIEANRPRSAPPVRRVILPPGVIDNISDTLAPYINYDGASTGGSSDLQWALGILVTGVTGAVVLEAVLESETGNMSAAW